MSNVLPRALDAMHTAFDHLRNPVVLVVAGGLALGACSSSPEPISGPTETAHSAEASPSPSTPEHAKTPDEVFLGQFGQTILADGESDAQGLRFRSAIQDGHRQTDRDVGAASTGMAFLRMATLYPREKQWLDAADRTAQWLMNVSQSDQDGRRWPDYADGTDVSSDVRTSFDDGAIGIADYLWRVSEQTGKQEYAQAAKEAVLWTLKQAEPAPDGSFQWSYDGTHNTGMGMGTPGIVSALADFYTRTKDSDPAFAAQCQRYIIGAEKHLYATANALKQRLESEDDVVFAPGALAMPEVSDLDQDGGTAMNAGYLSGAAGVAFMYLELAQHFPEHKTEYEGKAAQFLTWLNDTQNGPKVAAKDGSKDGAAAWKLMLDPEGDNDEHFATGMEEGAAGIGWVFLQAYHETKNPQYLHVAKQSANWLLKVATVKSGAYSWHKDEHPATAGPAHLSLNNGASGIGVFMADMAHATKDPRYQAAAKGAAKLIQVRAKVDARGKVTIADGDENDEGVYEPFKGTELSGHWGLGGQMELFMALTNYGDGKVPSMPGNHEAIPA